MIITFTNVIGAIRTAFSVVRSGLKMWLGFETSVANQEQVVDGDFPTGTTAWTLNTGWAIGNNKLNGTSAITENSQTIFASASSRKLKITYDVVVDSGQVAVYMTDKSKDWITQSGSYTDYVTSSSINIEIDGRDSSPFTGSVTNVSVEILNQITPDKSGNNNVGELFTGKALEFDGSTTYVSANSFAGTLSNNTAFTFAVWFNSDTPTDGRNFGNILISSGGANQATNIFKIGVNPRNTPDPNNNKNAGGIYFDDSYGYNNQVPSNEGVFYNDGEWHRLVVSRPEGSGAQDLSFYVDGSLIGTAPCNPYWNNMTVFDFGQEWDPLGTSDHFEGNMSDIQVYDYAWDTDDVTYDYANPNKLAIDNPSTDLVVTNLKAYWAMSEGAGLVAYDSGTNLEEEEVVDGNFPTGTTAWQLIDGATISDNKANIIGDGTLFTSIKQTGVFENGKVYQVVADVTITSGLGLKFQDGANNENIGFATTTGIYTFNFTGTSNADLVVGRRTSGTAFDSNVNSISVREITPSDHGALLFGVDHVDAQPRIPQLGMQNWAKSTPAADEITLIPNPTIPTQDILGNAVRDRFNSFNLDGSGYATNKTLPTISGNISLSFWVKLDTFVSGNLGQVVGKREGSSWLRVYRPYASNLRLEVAAGEQYTFAVTENQWVYVAITINSSDEASVYVDNSAAIGTTLDTSFSFINTEVFTVGAWLDPALVATSKLNGLVSDVLIYDRVLTSDEVRNNYNAGLSAHTN